MRAKIKLLIVVDKSPASRRALSHVAKMLGGRRGFQFCLSEVLPPLPPGLLEHEGAEDPHEERQLEIELRREQHAWVSDKKRRSAGSLRKASTLLHKAGICNGEIETRYCGPSEGRDAADELLTLARSRKCHTIVVGRESHSWVRDLFHSYLAEELVRRARGFTIWVVE